MKRLHGIVFTLLITSISGFAASDEAVDFSAVEETVRKALPNTQITAIQPAPIEGLVEIVAGRNVLYSDPSGRYLVVGSIYDMQSATDLTAERRAQASAIRWESLPLDMAVKYGGSGPQKLAVFFDPDCPWCKKLHDQLTTLKDIEVYAIMYPVEGLHPDARRKAATILCSGDPLKALDAVMAGRALPADANSACLERASARITEVEAFARDHNIHATPTLVAPDGRVRPGFITEERLRAWLDAANRG